MLSSIIKLSLAASALLSITNAAVTPLPRRELTTDDIMLLGADGRVEVMDKATYLTQSSTTIGRPASTLNTTVATRDPSSAFSKRGCKYHDVLIMNEPQSFLNWDVPMSSVVFSAPSTTATVAITDGYSIGNTVSVSLGTSLTLIEGFLSTSLGISYSESWTSTATVGYTFSIPDGKYGAVVSNPLTTRNSGRLQSGCVGDFSNGVEFVSDSYSSRAYGSLSWVEGTISLCTGDEYPMKMCVGDGTLS